MNAAPNFFEQRKARQWLRDHEISARLPRPGRRLLVIGPDLAAGNVVIERVEYHIEGRILQRYYIGAAGAPR